MIAKRLRIGTPMMRTMKHALLAVFLVLAISSASQAGPLNVPVDTFPSISAFMITSIYTGSTGLLTANGSTNWLDTTDAHVSLIVPFRITAHINSSGRASDGTLNIGSTTSPFISSSTLLDFAFNPVKGGALEFLFGSSAGSYVGDGAPFSAGVPIDVILTVGTQFLGNFSSSWTSTSNTAKVQEASTPEPSTLLLMLVGVGGLCRGLRKKRAGARASAA